MNKHLKAALAQCFKGRLSVSANVVAVPAFIIAVFPVDKIAPFLHIKDDTLRIIILVASVGIFLINLIYRIISYFLHQLNEAEKKIEAEKYVVEQTKEQAQKSAEQARRAAETEKREAIQRAVQKTKEVTEKAASEAFTVPTDLRFPAIKYEREGSKDLFYVDFQDALRIDTVVSLYFYKEPNSRKVCNGIVIDREAGESVTVQAIPESVEKDREHLYSEMKNDNEQVLNKIYILPILMKDDVKEVNQFLG